MRTPGHAAINLAVFARTTHAHAALLGAVVPDVPIAALYAWERFVRGTPDERIWSEAYQRPAWQAAIHGAHSIPLVAAGAILSAWLGATSASVFFASMLLHSLADLPVHVEDAHRHFIPFSSWRFISAISYWDVRYHGRVVAALEATAVWIAALATWPTVGLVGRTALVAVCAWYVHGYWQTFVRHRGRWQPYF